MEVEFRAFGGPYILLSLSGERKEIIRPLLKRADKRQLERAEDVALETGSSAAIELSEKRARKLAKNLGKQATNVDCESFTVPRLEAQEAILQALEEGRPSTQAPTVQPDYSSEVIPEPPSFEAM